MASSAAAAAGSAPGGSGTGGSRFQGVEKSQFGWVRGPAESAVGCRPETLLTPPPPPLSLVPPRYQMLAKMGWKEGRGLGQREDGITSHVRVKSVREGGGKEKRGA